MNNKGFLSSGFTKQSKGIHVLKATSSENTLQASCISVYMNVASHKPKHYVSGEIITKERTEINRFLKPVEKRP